MSLFRFPPAPATVFDWETGLFVSSLSAGKGRECFVRLRLRSVYADYVVDDRYGTRVGVGEGMAAFIPGLGTVGDRRFVDSFPRGQKNDRF